MTTILLLTQEIENKIEATGPLVSKQGGCVYNSNPVGFSSLCCDEPTMVRKRPGEKVIYNEGINHTAVFCNLCQILRIFKDKINYLSHDDTFHD